MRSDSTGPAVVFVYANRTLESAAYHEHDGGEAYMAPLIRQAVRYARTHYDDGDIMRVLLSEPEMREIGTDALGTVEAKHEYVISYRYDAETGRKSYSARVRHSDTARPVVPPRYEEADSGMDTLRL